MNATLQTVCELASAWEIRFENEPWML